MIKKDIVYGLAIGLLALSQILHMHSDYKAHNEIYKFQQLQLEHNDAIYENEQLEQEIRNLIQKKGKELESRLDSLEKKEMLKEAANDKTY